MSIEEQVNEAIKRAKIEELEQRIKEVEDLFPDKGFEGYFQCQFDVIQILEKRISELKGENNAE